MAKAHTHGTGWHKESLRHSNARRLGRAGGKYKSSEARKFHGTHLEMRRNMGGIGNKITFERVPNNYSFPNLENVSRKDKIDFLMKSHLHTRVQLESMDDNMLNDFTEAGLNATGYIPYGKKDMSYNQLKKVGIKLKPSGDADKDGVPNSLDCRPLNKHKQDDMPVSEIDDFLANAENEKTTTTVTTTNPKTHKVREAFEKTSEYLKEQGEKAKKARKENRERQADKIQKELERDEYLDEDDKARIADLDPRELTPEELKVLAIREGDSFFGGNKYESEILRRIKEEAKIETDKAILINEEKARARKAIAEDNPNKPREQNFIEWLTKP